MAEPMMMKWWTIKNTEKSASHNLDEQLYIKFKR